MPDEHVDRVLRQGDLWPMAEGPHAMDDLKAILESRSALYAEAGATVSTSRRAEAQAVTVLLAAITGEHSAVDTATSIAKCQSVPTIHP